MQFLKTLSAVAVATAALMSFASSASATDFTITTPTLPNPTLDTIKEGSVKITASLKEKTKAILKSSFIGEVVCEASTVNGTTTNVGSSTETIKGNIETLTFTMCNSTVTVLKNGTLELHTEKTEANGNGTLTSNGAEVTIELAGLHCIFTTSNTDVGTVTGTHEGHVIFSAKSAAIPRTGGRSGAFCGSSASWNAEYTVTEIHWTHGAVTETFTNFTID